VDVINSEIYSAEQEWSRVFRAAVPLPHVVLDNFLDAGIADTLTQDFPDIATMPRSRVYVFGDKHELPQLEAVSPTFAVLRQELLSPRFQRFIETLCGEELILDASFFGGGLYQSGNGGFLDMHTDFNTHPSHPTWLRRLNFFLYLTKDWKVDYGGSLRLRSGREGTEIVIPPLFNRCVIMASNHTTYHGFDRLQLPAGITRKTVAAICYREQALEDMPSRNSTIWDPGDRVMLKPLLAKIYSPLVVLKNRLFGSATSRFDARRGVSKINQSPPDKSKA